MAFKLHQELVHHTQDDCSIERAEGNDGVQPIAKFGCEHALDVGHFVALALVGGEANAGLLQGLGAGVGCHDNHHIAKIRLASVVVGQGAVVHYLQQDIEHLRVRLFDFVQQQHGVRLLGNGFGKQSALIKADIAGRRADQPAYGMAFHVFGHVEANQFDAHAIGQLARYFGFSDASRPGEQEAANGLLRVAQSGARHFDRSGQGINGRFLAEDHVLQIAIQVLQRRAVVG